MVVQAIVHKGMFLVRAKNNLINDFLADYGLEIIDGAKFHKIPINDVGTVIRDLTQELWVEYIEVI